MTNRGGAGGRRPASWSGLFASLWRGLVFAVRSMSMRRARVAFLATGIAVASASFSLLSTAVTTSRAETIGTVSDNARSAYDVLVRPKSSITPVEVARGTVRDNYLSGIFGGITTEDYEAIRNLPGVEVAAPVANLGYANVVGDLPINFDDFGLNETPGLYRLKVQYSAANGAASYSDADQYLFYSGTTLSASGFGNTERTLQVEGQTLWPCWYYNLDPRGVGFEPNPRRQQSTEAFPRGQSAFDPEIRSTLSCRPATPGADDKADESSVVGLPVAFPVLLAAIDPEQEDALVGLGGAVVDGRYLTADEAPAVESDQGLRFARVPFLLSASAFSDVDVSVQLQQLDSGPAEDLAARLDSPDARPWVDSLPGQSLADRTFDLAEPFESLVRDQSGLFFQRTGSGSGGEVDGTWINGPVAYGGAADGPLSVGALPDADPQVWGSRNLAGQGFDANVPVDNLATQVRPVSPVAGVRCGPCAESENFLSPVVVGRFDPDRLRGFSGLSRVPLETYREPVAIGADLRSRDILNEEPLRPDRNLGGYLTQPPALLTTIASLDEYFASRIGSEEQAAAPISSIRIRVAGVSGIDDLSRERVAAVAAAIVGTVGDDAEVEVTLGSSPAPQIIALPAGVYGPQPLSVDEQWAEKGVGLRIIEAVDRKSFLLFVLVLVVCVLFVAQGALASVRSRRTEIATLGALGWTRRQAAAAVLTEVVIVGAVGGLIGVAAAAGTGELLGVRPDPLTVLLAFPIAVAVATCAGLAPALWVTRLDPVAGLSPAVVPASRARRAGSLWALALVSARRRPVRTLVGASGLGLAVAALTFLVGATLAYRGQVAGNLLGSAVVEQARAVDFISIAILFVLGTVSLADVLLLSRRESARDQAMLLASGWSTKEVTSLIVREAVIVGGLGGVAGVSLGLALSVTTGWSALDAQIVLGLLQAAGLALLAALLTLLLAALAPVLVAVRSSPSRVLARD